MLLYPNKDEEQDEGFWNKIWKMVGVIEEYFTKELENNLLQHKANERIMRYKLEVYKNKKSRFYMYFNKYRGIRLGWGYSNNAQWNISERRSTDWGDTKL